MRAPDRDAGPRRKRDPRDAPPPSPELQRRMREMRLTPTQRDRLEENRLYRERTRAAAPTPEQLAAAGAILNRKGLIPADTSSGQA